MMRNLIIGMLCLMLVVPSLLAAEGGEGGQPAGKSGSSAMASPPSSAVPQDQQPASVRPNSTSQQRSYARETQHRHRSRHISKGEIVFMAGIAGTSMGIGAIAGGGTGLAIGAIVGGWGAYVGHRIWHWVNK